MLHVELLPLAGGRLHVSQAFHNCRSMSLHCGSSHCYFASKYCFDCSIFLLICCDSELSGFGSELFFRKSRTHTGFYFLIS